MFDPDRFVKECRDAVASGGGQETVRKIVAEAIADPASILASMGDEIEPGTRILYQGEDLTALIFTWAPFMAAIPHNHNIWAVIGIFWGREDNIIWKRNGDRIEAVGAKALSPGDVAALPNDAIHSVINPIDKMSSAIHVYGGDFFAAGRSEWNPETLTESPFNMERAMSAFDDANQRLKVSL